MKFGCCGSMIKGYGDGMGIGVLEDLAKIGYDYIEMPLCKIADLKLEEFEQLKRTVLASGIRCEACNNFFPGSIRLTGPETEPARIYEYASYSLERAVQLGTKVVVLGSGGARKVPEGFSFAKAWDQLVTVAGKLGSIAREYGITIALEPLRKEECNIINTVEEGSRLVRQVNHPAFRLLADYYHMTSEKEKASILEEAGDLLEHVHFARFKERSFPIDIHEDNYSWFIDALKKARYSKRVSIEAFTGNFYEDAVASYEFLKKYFI